MAADTAWGKRGKAALLVGLRDARKTIKDATIVTCHFAIIVEMRVMTDFLMITRAMITSASRTIGSMGHNDLSTHVVL